MTEVPEITMQRVFAVWMHHFLPWLSSSIAMKCAHGGKIKGACQTIRAGATL
jgi:hypothetical protein